MNSKINKGMGMPFPQNIRRWPVGTYYSPKEMEIDAESLAVLAPLVVEHIAELQKEDNEKEKLLKATSEKEEAEVNKRVQTLTLELLRNLNPAGKAPAYNRLKTLGYKADDGPMDGYNHWLRTGAENDDLAELEKAAYQEDTDTEGGYAVPEGGYNRFAEKRDEKSIARIMGANVEKVKSNVFKIPTEDTKMTEWTIVAEEGAADEDEGDFGQFVATVYLFSKMQKFSVQVLRDSEPDILGHVTGRNGRSLGLTENLYFLTGTGIGQPQGACVGGTEAQVLASASTITAAEVLTNIYALGDPYAENAVWTAKGSTEKVIRSLQGDPFLFAPTPQGEQAGPRLRDIGGHKIFRSAKMAAFAVDAVVLLLGDWRDYTIVENEKIFMQRNPYLYQATHQVAFFSYVRMGGGVEVAEAFQYSSAAAA